MSVTRIYLADLAHTYSVGDRSLTVPLSLGYIKAYAHAALGDSVEITLFKHPDRFLVALDAAPPSIIGFANYGWNENLNRAFGAYARQRCPDALIVAGGPNIDPDPARRGDFLFRHGYVDYLVIDGGEQPFSELVTWWHDTDRDPANLPTNLVWRRDGHLHETGERPLKKVIDDIPSPYLSGFLDEFLAAGMIPMFETNRGCPFKCTFCAWGSASKDLVRRMDLDQALAEIAYVGERSDARNWIVCDANFGILKRDVDLAHAIRKVHEAKGHPAKCHIWLAKNATDRNLDIGSILGDMTVPVMAVQSLEDEVLENIKRDNISTDTYAEYQKKFHRMGSRTYSDLIVPLPGETLESHLDALRQLLDMGVDIVQNHNMRLLAGAETNSTETRERFGFETRYRLIHGDAGAYRAPDGSVIEVFEYEESLRSTTTMSEDDLFYLRKLHFLVDFCWNIEIYKPLLRTAQAYGLNPVDVLIGMIEASGAAEEVCAFFDRFDAMSREEWFDSAEAIETHFADPVQFERLINQEFEKLNILFSIVLLRDAKPAFDALVESVIRDHGSVPGPMLRAAADYSFSLFPSLADERLPEAVELPENYLTFDPEAGSDDFVLSTARRRFALSEPPARREVRRILEASRNQTLSKVLNTQGIALRDLRLSLQPAV